MTPSPADPTITARDRQFLRRAVGLARTALDAGDQPFGSVLVDVHGIARLEERNRIHSVDATRHPEFEIARWAAANMPRAERATSTVYTSGEHCPMCSAAHAMAGLGRIVYAASSAQLAGWLQDWGITPGPVAFLPITAVAPNLEVSGPVDEFTDELRGLHARLRGVTLDP